MPPQWAASGRRMEMHMLIRFNYDGTLTARLGPYLDMNVKGGKWKLEGGDTLRFFVDVSGFARFDVSLPEGPLYFVCNAWGPVISKKNNVLSIRARRFPFGTESRMVGTFRAESVDPQNEESLTLSPCRTKFRTGPDNPFQDDDL